MTDAEQWKIYVLKVLDVLMSTMDTDATALGLYTRNICAMYLVSMVLTFDRQVIASCNVQ